MKKLTILLLAIISVVIGINTLQARNIHTGNKSKEGNPQYAKGDSLKWSIDFLNKLLNSNGEWYLTDYSYKRPIKGVVDYTENDPIDTIVVNMHKLLSDKKIVYLVDRRPQDIKDFKSVMGYISDEEAQRRIEKLQKQITDSLNNVNILVPTVIIDYETSKAPLVPKGNPQVLMNERKNELPISFKSLLYERLDANKYRPEMGGIPVDSVRSKIFDSCRKNYNDSIMHKWHDLAISSYRSQFIADYSKSKINEFKKQIERRNSKLLASYNDKAVDNVNDSLKHALKYLTDHAKADSTLMRLYNLSGEKTELWTANREMKPIRMYLKNAQNDSLSVILINQGKAGLKLIIDDGVVFMRLSSAQKHEITFKTIEPEQKLQKINLKTLEPLPWSLFGTGSIGFTQTSLTNWSKGGESSLAMLLLGKYNANYSKKKVKWETNGEVRYGANQTKSKGFEKNDDKLEIQSRLGYSAFDKWFYSAEADFKTQLAPGYNYPDKSKPISEFMAPGYLTFSLGLDYKPNKNFSLFLSPLTSKTTYVRDTAKISPINFGLLPGQKRLWEPGMIVKSNWHKKIMDNIVYETKEEFFNNYKYTFQKYAIDWEQTLTMQVSHHISTIVTTELIYDYNVKFPILNSAGTQIGLTPKWQFMELINIGLNYKF
jgi:hypothetical protein